MKKLLLLSSMAAIASVATVAQVAPVKVAKRVGVENVAGQFKLQSTDMIGDVLSAKKMDKVVKSNSILTKADMGNLLKDEETEANSLSYMAPEGAMYCEYSFFGDNAGGYPMMYLPAYANHTWKNTSKGFSEFNWNYIDVESEEATASVVDLTTAHIAGFSVGGVDNVTPELTSGEASFQFSAALSTGTRPYEITYGWEPSLIGLDANVTLYSGFDEHLAGVGAYGEFIAGTADLAVSASYWMSDVDENIVSAEPVMFANMTPKPIAAYNLRSVNFPVALGTTEATKLSLALYVVKDGKLTALTSSEIDVPAQNMTWTNLEFPIRYTDKETGLTSEYVTVNEELMVVLTGFSGNDKITNIRPLTIAQDYDYAYSTIPFTGYTFVKYTDKEGNSEIIPEWMYNGWTHDDYESVPTQFAVSFDLYYPYIVLLDAQNDFNVEVADTIALDMDAEGELKYYQVYSYEMATDEDADPADWTITDENGDDLPEWLTVTAAYEQIEGGDEEDLYPFLTFVAEPLEDATFRKAIVRVEEMGAVKTFIVTQGEGEGAGNGISSVEAVAGEAGVAAVYTLEGKRVASTDDLAKGVYIVKKNDGSAVKVVKK